MSNAPLDKAYDPKAVESDINQLWLSHNAFHADPAAGGEPFSIVIPPPNVTAALHMGHALNNTIQDILTRHHRMRGDNTLWMPGTDHAGIATQAIVDKRLKAEGQPALAEYKKLELENRGGREQFIAKVQLWKDEYEATITNQLKAMGCSCDWDRQRFTMDPVCIAAVREAFYLLFRDGLIYRGKRLVNWDPASQTALSDDEVEMREIEGFFYYLRYPLVEPVVIGGQTFDHITVATTRPETMLGDTAVAMNPRDPRAAALKGRFIRLPIVNRVIPIVEDDYVVLPVDLGGSPDDPKAQFATGFLKVTPAHDPNDYEIGRRHDLPVINVMAPDGSISDKHGWSDVGEGGFLIGQSREAARQAIVKWFEQNNLLQEFKPYTHSVGHSYRSHVPIEPYLSDQWYVGVTRQIPGLPAAGPWPGTELPTNSLAGLALQALANSSPPLPAPDSTSRDREGAVPSPLPAPGSTSRDREGAVLSPLPTRPNTMAGLGQHYFITFTTYGTWLHGDPRGSVDADHNTPGTLPLSEDQIRLRTESSQAKHPSFSLDTSRRNAVQDAIREVCEHRGWRLLALHVRTNHVHVVVFADDQPERVMIDFKAYATRRMTSLGLAAKDQSIWTRHGSTRYLNDETSALAACKYVIDEQGEWIDPNPVDGRIVGCSAFKGSPLPYGRGSLNRGGEGEPLPYGHGSLNRGGEGEPLPHGHGSLNRGGKEEPLPHGRGSLSRGGEPSAQSDSWKQGLRFHPARYAKTFQSWHENIRDWCISRQLWWGHRIPVWTGQALMPPKDALINETLEEELQEYERELQERLNDYGNSLGCPQAFTARAYCDGGQYRVRICVRNAEADRHFQQLFGYTNSDIKYATLPADTYAGRIAAEISNRVRDLIQDPDVLDTWFSSALWPMSTMGWPNPELFPADIPEGSALLDKWNPTSLLCTAREIITLWVSRMVMFNLYFLKRLPFRDVFIHAMIQDGEGQKMSKSLGNGVDPLDIIHSHGADGMRFTLASMTTHTQDVRMPVDVVCPHSGQAFKPKTTRTASGHIVAAPIQISPADPSKKMVSSFGIASGQAKATPEMPAARNTSSKFDFGRNFANKLWNAVRFALMNLEGLPPCGPENPADYSLADRWIRSRLASTLRAVDQSLTDYQFNHYIQSSYDFFWRDLCDWYLEAIKPVVRELTAAGDAARRTLTICLDACLRILHPATPYITEKLFSALNDAAPQRAAAGIAMGPSKLLINAAWPRIDASWLCERTEKDFTLIQEIIGAIRNIRNEYNLPPKKDIQIRIKATAPLASLLGASAALIANLANAIVQEIGTDLQRPVDAAVQVIGDLEIYACGLIDPQAERDRLTKQLEQLTKSRTGLHGRLNNKGYIDRAPAHLVEETRKQLADVESEIARVEAGLAQL